ncbi:RNA polymerase sigma factor, partial [Striga asiatica]
RQLSDVNITTEPTATFIFIPQKINLPILPLLDEGVLHAKAVLAVQAPRPFVGKSHPLGLRLDRRLDSNDVTRSQEHVVGSDRVEFGLGLHPFGDDDVVSVFVAIAGDVIPIEGVEVLVVGLRRADELPRGQIDVVAPAGGGGSADPGRG